MCQYKPSKTDISSLKTNTNKKMATMPTMPTKFSIWQENSKSWQK
jgi:hypothetical protein